MDELLRSTIGEKGRVVIPAQFREALGLKAGDTVFIEIVDGDLRISSFESRRKISSPGNKNMQRDSSPSHDEGTGPLALTLDAPVYTTDRAWENLDVGCRIHMLR